MAETGGGSSGSGDHSHVRVRGNYLPIANITRIMKKVLPADGKIAKDSKEMVQEYASEFISFITSEASYKCQREKRKTINGDDLLSTMATQGFEDYSDLLKIYLDRYRDVSGSGDSSSGRKDAAGAGGGQNAQLAYQGSFSEDFVYPDSFFQDPVYPDSQGEQHMMFQMPDPPE